MVTMKDYEGMAGFGGGGGGFGTATSNEVEDLNKALSAGYQSPRQDGGSALRVESLEATLRILTHTQKHVVMWKDIPKLPAFSTTEEYNVQTSYGGDSGPFTREGELPQTQDASYERRVALVKYLGTQREVTHPMTLVRPAHGNAIAVETQNGTLWLMEQMERQIFFGNSRIIPEAFDGLEAQLLADPIGGVQNVIDLRGGTLTESNIEEATNIIVEAYGVPSDLYGAPRSLSDLVKTMYPRERVNLPAPENGTIGMAISKVATQAGVINLKGDIFLRSGRNNGARTAPTSATSGRSPTAPTVVGAAVAAAPGSLFGTPDAGTYQYRVTAINRFGESASALEAGGVAVALGEGVDLTITDGGGSEPATGYRLYRSRVDGADGTQEYVKDIPRVGAAATTVYRDLNVDLPGYSKAFLNQMNLQAVGFRQLAPMMKIPLATIAASIRWMQLLYGTPILYAPRKIVMFRNVLDR
jgi:hypothetical protein